MAMNGPVWGNQIANDLLNRNVNSSKLSTSERNDVFAIWDLICSDNVGHITANAVGTQGNDSNGDSEQPVTIS